ncbi:DUF1656 domain-containing protein [Pseudooceanicola sp. GBMRC 2024]|uniref:DUF1656 domain-containing protein n=1 Tax=Pseudooceanicola albus TaxID=2692189 RepID=A0A6L7G1J5_9RHOB|nr:DUF1656 domain-containing protein [Pseudooceanicola albus]MXN17925.1 DUF1656 domain-containing protein [Pseudooceanicola albus]
MSPDLDLAGVFLPTLLVLMLLCYAAFRLLHRALARIGLYRHVWHPALFDIALYVSLVGASVLIQEQFTP